MKIRKFDIRVIAKAKGKISDEEIADVFIKVLQSHIFYEVDQAEFEYHPIKKKKKKPEVNVDSYIIHTGMGMVHDSFDLPFLGIEQFKEFNVIGYTGRSSDGKPTSRVEYLNSLGIGTFSIQQTKSDSGDFSETFVISRSQPK